MNLQRRSFIKKASLALASGSLYSAELARDKPGTGGLDRVIIQPRHYRKALRNPLMGFRPDMGPQALAHEYATLVRHYIRWNQIENVESDGPEKIQTFCDSQWSGLPAANIKVIPRVYLHWATEQERYWPADLSPGDYSSSAFLCRVSRLISRLGACWDGDPRVAFIQMGFIGKWGEHHSPEISADLQKLLGEAFTRAFPAKPVLVRHPWDFKGFKFGIYWDSFAHFDQMSSHGAGIEAISPRWKSAPIGGEVAYDWGNYRLQPGNSPDDTLSDGGHRRFLIDAIRRFHANHLGWVADYNPRQPGVHSGAEEVQRAFGYHFVIGRVEYPAQVESTVPFQVEFTVQNLGSTPLYAHWPVEVSFLDPETRRPVWSAVFSDADTHLWLPGDAWDPDAQEYRTKPEWVCVAGLFTIDRSVPKGVWMLALAILDPAGRVPNVRFSIWNYFRGGRHPIGWVGVGRRPTTIEIAESRLDDPSEDRSLRYG